MSWLTNKAIREIPSTAWKALKSGYGEAKTTALAVSKNSDTIFTGIRSSFKPSRYNMAGAAAGAAFGAYDNRRDFQRGDYFKGIVGTMGYGAAGYGAGSAYRHFSQNGVGQVIRSAAGGVRRGWAG